MRAFYEEHRAVIEKFIFLAAFLLGAYIFVKYIFAFVAPFVIGYFVSLILNPIANFFHSRYKISRGVSAVFLLIIAILLIAAAGSSVIGRILTEASAFAESLPDTLEDIKALFGDLRLRFEAAAPFIPAELGLGFDDIVTRLVSYLAVTLGDFAKNTSVGIVTGLPGTFVGFFLCVVSSFFFVKDKAAIHETISRISPKWLITRLKTVRRGFLGALSAYVRAQLVIMSIVAVICVLGLVVLDYPYALLVGVLLSVLDALPIIGSSIAFFPWAAYSFFTRDYRFATGLLIINAASFLTRQIIEPKILGKQLGAHPLLALISTYVGLKVFGIGGLVLVPILFITSKLILESEASYGASESKDWTEPNEY